MSEGQKGIEPMFLWRSLKAENVVKALEGLVRRRRERGKPAIPAKPRDPAAKAPPRPGPPTRRP